MTDRALFEDVMAELAEMEEPGLRAVNAGRGDDHAVNLSALRALAKRLGTRHELALDLWQSGETAARLLATLVARPKGFAAAELDRMVHEIGTQKLLDWFVTHVVKPGRHGEALREGWMAAPGLVGRAGWSLATTRVIKAPEGLDLEALLETIERELGVADEPRQWAMNHCLAEIGIRNPELRRRAVAIGEKHRFLIDYPVPRGCTSPYAPLWIAEMVQRAEA